VITHARDAGATLERVVAVAYPIMDVVLVVAIVPRSSRSASPDHIGSVPLRGLTAMLVADTVFARLVPTAPTSTAARWRLWPVAYSLLAPRSSTRRCALR
jgi:hypothetical protein